MHQHPLMGHPPYRVVSFIWQSHRTLTLSKQQGLPYRLSQCKGQPSSVGIVDSVAQAYPRLLPYVTYSIILVGVYGKRPFSPPLTVRDDTFRWAQAQVEMPPMAAPAEANRLKGRGNDEREARRTWGLALGPGLFRRALALCAILFALCGN